MIFYLKLFWNIRSSLNSSTFWVFEPVFRYVWSKLKLFAQKMKIFIKVQAQNVEEISLDLIFFNNFWQSIKSVSKQNSKLIIHSKTDRNQSKLTVCNSYQKWKHVRGTTTSLASRMAVMPKLKNKILKNKVWLLSREPNM